MRLREHPRVDWPPAWSESTERSPVEGTGTLKEIELIEEDQAGPTRLLLTGEFKENMRFAEINCMNETFARRLYEKIKPLCGREMKEVDDLEIEG